MNLLDEKNRNNFAQQLIKSFQDKLMLKGCIYTNSIGQICVYSVPEVKRDEIKTLLREALSSIEAEEKGILIVSHIPR